MTSFFEKLKKGMGAEAPVKEEILEKPEARIPKPKTLQKEKKPPKEPKEIPSEQVKKIEPEFKEKLLESPKAKEFEKKKIEVKKTEETKQKPTKEKGDLESPTSSIKISGEKAIGDKEKWLQPEGELAVDVYQTKEEIVIQSTIAGIKPESLDISVENDVVTIRGSRERPEETEERDYFYQECYWGPFSRKIILPEETDPSRTDATMKEGVLTIRIPKIQKEKKRKIIVQA
jgi:HSP20 family molecular chaperone IbpA